MMKYNLILLIVIALVFSGCEEKEVNMPFEARNGIYFGGNQGVFGDFQPLDSIAVSFGLRPDTIRFDTIRVKVTFLGRKSADTRKFKVKVIEKSTKGTSLTDMQEGVHYLPLQTDYEFAPDSYTAIMELIIDRSQFNTSFHQAEEHTLVLQLQESEDFYVGIDEARELVIKVNNYMAKPAWWELEGFTAMEKKLGFYHPEKWNALIYVDAGFANPDELPFDKHNGIFMSNKIETAKNLNPWWPKKDAETGDLIYFDRIVTANN